MTLAAARIDSHKQMFGPRTAILAACWTFLLAPILCGAGMLEHPCDCSPAGCSRESDCATDPCDQVVARKDDAPHADAATCLAATPVVPEPVGAEPSAGVGLALSWAGLEPAHSRLIHDSDLPLLN